MEPENGPLEDFFLYNPVVFRFNVNLPGCMCWVFIDPHERLCHWIHVGKCDQHSPPKTAKCRTYLLASICISTLDTSRCKLSMPDV